MNYLLYVLTVIKKNRFRNLYNLLKRKGKLVCPNGYVLYFDRHIEKDIKKLYEFCISTGTKFYDKEGYWNYNDGIITTPQGLKFKVKMFDSLIFSETFLHDIHFSFYDLRDKIVIQAGGFVGDTALYYAYRGAKVYSFEPDPYSYNLALENIKLNPNFSKNIVMKNYAIGNDGEIDFPINKEGSGGSSAFGLAGYDTVKVRSISLQTILSEFNLDSPFLLDLDIKGKEFEIINEDALSKFKIIRIEYSTSMGNKIIGTRQEILNRLSQKGFHNIRIYKHNWGRYDLTEHGTIEAVNDNLDLRRSIQQS